MLTKAFTQHRLLRDELEKLAQEHGWWSILQDCKETVDGLNTLKMMANLSAEERERVETLSDEVWEQIGKVQDNVMRIEGIFGTKIGWREIMRLHGQIRRTSCPEPIS